VRRYVQGANQVLPLRFEELPAALTFDAVFSMGVIYHRRDPLDHVRRLYRHLRPGGQLVIESLIVEGTTLLAPAGRYARMRNVHLLPTSQVLAGWLEEAGFKAVRVADVCVTSTAEQRSTGWMRFESLAEALDPADPGRTLEGHPAPRRAIVVARKPV
jgi:tRNA (mo5U34)-methyltransferase